MIVAPLNDHGCLSAITEAARAKVDAPEMVEIAANFDTTLQLVHWIRSLPHRPDTADPVDGPKVMCDVPQRFRLPTWTPNCVERSGMLLALAELIDPDPVRCLATVNLPQGRHTFPIEDGRPVILDPVVPRNALCAGIDAIDRAAGRTEPLTFATSLAWIVDVAEEPAAMRAGGRRRVRRARRAMAGVLDNSPVTERDLAALLWCCALAEREAAWWGKGRAHVVARAVRELGRQVTMVSPRDRLRVEFLPAGQILGSVGKVAGRVAGPLALGALKVKLASLGVPPQLVDQVAAELAREKTAIAQRHAGGHREDRDGRERTEDERPRRRRAIDHRAA